MSLLHQNIPKTLCGRVSAPDPIREAHSVPQTSQSKLAATCWRRKEKEDKNGRKERKLEAAEVDERGLAGYLPVCEL